MGWMRKREKKNSSEKKPKKGKVQESYFAKECQGYPKHGAMNFY